LFIRFSFFLFFLLFLAPQEVKSEQFLSLNEGPYFSLESSRFSLLISEEEREKEGQGPHYWQNLAVVLEHFHKKMESSFGYLPKEKFFLVMASQRNQMANALATLYPLSLNIIYSGGASQLEYFAASSWIEIAFFHEMIHLYQMSPTQGLGNLASSLFGKSPFVSPLRLAGLPLLWLFPYPSSLLNTWILEGNAVFNESVFLQGGRLYNGILRALFLSLISQKDFTLKRLSNKHGYFPFEVEKYVVGGYFFYYLAQNFGIEKVNQFFKEHSSRWGWPFSLSSSFKAHYGLPLETLFENFKEWALNAFKEKSPITNDLSEKPPLLLSQSPFFFSPSVSEEEGVYILATSKARRPSDLWLFKKFKKFKEFKEKNSESPLIIIKGGVDMSKGNFFEIEKENFYSVGALGASSGRKIYGLWQGTSLLPSSENKIYQQKTSSTELYFEAKESFEQAILYKNQEKIGVCHSSAILDSKEQAYCFRQLGESRQIFKENTFLAEYKGFFGIPVQVLDDKFFFIANTKGGSSLFAYDLKKKKFLRAHPSTSIDKAFIFSEEKILLSEVSSQGYALSTSSLSFSSKEQRPFFENMSKNLSFGQEKSLSVPSSSQTASFSSYNSLGQMKFALWDTAVSISNSAPSYTLTGKWIDPLANNMLSFSGLHFPSSDKTRQTSGRLLYSYTRFSLSPSLGVAYRDRPNKKPKEENSHQVSPLVSLTWTHVFNDRWAFILHPEAKINLKNTKKNEYIGEFGLNYKREFSLALYPESNVFFAYQYRQEDQYSDKYHLFFAQLSKRVIGDFYFQVEGKAIDLLEGEYIFSPQDFVSVPVKELPQTRRPETFRSLQNRALSSYMVGRASAAILGVVDLGLVFVPTYFPLGLRRLAIGPLGHYYWGDSSLYGKTIKPWDLGGLVNVEILVAHTIPVSFDLAITQEISTKNIDSSSSLGVVMNLKSSF